MNILCNGNAANAKEEISFFQSFRDVDLEIFKTRRSFVEKLDLLAGRKDKIIVMGGDGTVSLAVQKLAGTETALGIIPAGRGNDFSQFLGIPGDALEAFWLAQEGSRTKVSLGGIDRRYFCNSFGIGFDAYVVGLVQRYNKRSYKLTALKNIFKFEGFKASISAKLRDGSDLNISENILMVVFANGMTEGGGVHISHKEPEDQYLSMTVVYDLIGLKRLLTLPFFFTFSFDKPKAVESYKVRSADIQVSKNVRKQLDGDVFYGDVEKAVVHPKAVTVLT